MYIYIKVCGVPNVPSSNKTNVICTGEHECM